MKFKSSLFTIVAIISLLCLVSNAKFLCDEDDQIGFFEILNTKFTETSILDREIFSTVQTNDKYTYDSDCGGEYATCRGSLIQLDKNGLNFATRKEQIDEFAYMSSGVNTRDKFVIKRTTNAITRICIKAKMSQYIDGISPIIRLVANNAFDLNAPRFDSLGEEETEDSSSTESNLGFLPSKKKNPGYEPHYDRTGSEALVCNYDYGQVTVFEQQKDEFISGFSFQSDKSVHCQYPKDNKSVQINTKYNSDDVIDFGVEYGPSYVALYKDNVLIKNITHVDDETPILVSNNEFYYISIESRVNKEKINELDNGEEYKFQILGLQISHFDPEVTKEESIFDIKLGFIALGIFTLAGVLAFLAIFACGAALNKRKRAEQLDFEEDLLLNN
jgi:hypothetical protein